VSDERSITRTASPSLRASAELLPAQQHLAPGTCVDRYHLPFAPSAPP